VAQIIIYAGAIMVLFLFVVMLLNAPKEDAAEWDRTHPLRQPGVARWGTLLAALLIVQLATALMAVREYRTPVGAQSDPATVNSVADMGRALFTRHTFAFEATSILILVAMVGAVVLARREGDQ
jgi:NADH-quinone oxidoreductase subunit J